jgi:hypothetical protein
MATFSESFSEPVSEPCGEGSRQEHGAWNREQGTGITRPEAASIVAVCTRPRASALSVVGASSERWMGAPRLIFGGVR